MYNSQIKESTSITPHMIREAVEILQMKRLFVNTALITDYLIRYYPIDNKVLEIELESVLKRTVQAGLIVKCGYNEFCIPTLLQDANTSENPC